MLRLFVARHGETVFNAAGRLQGDHPHTPLTAAGCRQAICMGEALARHLAAEAVDAAGIRLMASDTGRALQTLALVAEPLGLDWHAATTDARLREIDMGEWGGRWYRDIAPDIATLIDPADRLFSQVAPGGESYADVAGRLGGWMAELPASGTLVVISHGMTARVLRGLMTRCAAHAVHGVPIAPPLAQGSMVEIMDGHERIVVDGAGGGERA